MAVTADAGSGSNCETIAVILATGASTASCSSGVTCVCGGSGQKTAWRSGVSVTVTRTHLAVAVGGSEGDRVVALYAVEGDIRNDEGRTEGGPAHVGGQQMGA